MKFKTLIALLMLFTINSSFAGGWCHYKFKNDSPETVKIYFNHCTNCAVTTLGSKGISTGTIGSNNGKYWSIIAIGNNYRCSAEVPANVNFTFTMMYYGSCGIESISECS